MRRLTALLVAALLPLPAAAQIDARSGRDAAVSAVMATDRPADDLKLDESRRPGEMLPFMQLAPGMRVYDVLAGGGYYSDLIARIVGPKGTVVALNPPGLSTSTAALWQQRTGHLPNITQENAQFDDAAFAAPAFDRALFHLTYHDLYWESAQYGFKRTDPDRFLTRLFAAMKPGGKVIVIDHVGPAGVDPRAEAEAAHRIDPERIKADFARAGFRLEAESQALRASADDKAKTVFDPAIRGRTDRVAFRFVRP